ncbi:MAG: nucleotidyltransferase domain-containing protein, partial [Candidatus Omnitrophica bacterium]|nr:nucleotidyltransferase domain-containing protein [Candidatus Omnitrophota bacterium]
MNMELIFSTKERIKILKEVIFKTDSISVNKIAAKLKLSKGLISKYFDILTKGHILRKSKAGIFVSDRPITKSIKILLNITDININFFKKYPFVKSVGLYGSCAKGENTQESDIDVWIRV